MDLNLLPLFVTVAESPNFSEAARRLGLKRASVSRGVAALEGQLQVQLFNRTTRKVALTAAGKALYAKVAPGLASLREAAGSLPEQEEAPSGRLRLTTTPDLGTAWLPGMLATFATRYPAVVVEVHLGHQMVDLVAEGFDCALRMSRGRLADSSLIARKVGELDGQIFASPEYLARRGPARTPAELAGHDWVSFREVPLPSPFAGVKLRARVVGDDMLFVHRAVLAGLGLGFLPGFLTQEDVAAGRLVRLCGRQAPPLGTLHFVYPQAQHVPRKVTAFRDLLLEYAAAHPLAARPA